MNIYVGNLAYEVKDADLLNAFSAFGKVTSAKVIMDAFSGKSKGFGFVEMEVKEEAERAIAELNGQDFQGRRLIVNEARPREPRREGGGPNRGGGFGGGRRPPRG